VWFCASRVLVMVAASGSLELGGRRRYDQGVEATVRKECTVRLLLRRGGQGALLDLLLVGKRGEGE
jgi:hypothetical protein